MDVKEFVRQAPSFSAKNHPEKIRAFGWFLHSQGQERFGAADLKRCYDASNLAKPVNMQRFLDSLAEKRPPELLKDAGGFRLAQEVRDRLDLVYGKAEVVIVVERMLTDLPGKIADEAERLFLDEALTCYRHRAFRAAIVMVWNLAYDHVARWVLADPTRLAEFNAGIPARNRAKAHVKITTRDDFAELTEGEAVDILGGVTGVTDNMKKMLKEKLGRRNTYAHPSTMIVDRPQVDDMITELVNNAILRLTL